MKTTKLIVTVLTVAFVVVLGWFIYRVGGIHAYMDYQAARWCSFTSIDSVADYVVFCLDSIKKGTHIMFW